jgi:hypothetical protein
MQNLITHSKHLRDIKYKNFENIFEELLLKRKAIWLYFVSQALIWMGIITLIAAFLFTL